jgi:hypothetical protein
MVMFRNYLGFFVASNSLKNWKKKNADKNIIESLILEIYLK